MLYSRTSLLKCIYLRFKSNRYSRCLKLNTAKRTSFIPLQLFKAVPSQVFSILITGKGRPAVGATSVLPSAPAAVLPPSLSITHTCQRTVTYTHMHTGTPSHPTYLISYWLDLSFYLQVKSDLQQLVYFLFLFNFPYSTVHARTIPPPNSPSTMQSWLHHSTSKKHLVVSDHHRVKSKAHQRTHTSSQWGPTLLSTSYVLPFSKWSLNTNYVASLWNRY